MTRDQEALREYMDDENYKELKEEGLQAEQETGLWRRMGPESLESACELRRRARRAAAPPPQAGHVILPVHQPAAEQEEGKALVTSTQAPKKPLLWDSCSTAHIVTVA